ncbi:CG31870, partial [Drosophila busckii]
YLGSVRYRKQFRKQLIESSKLIRYNKPHLQINKQKYKLYKKLCQDKQDLDRLLIRCPVRLALRAAMRACVVVRNIRLDVAPHCRRLRNPDPARLSIKLGR